MFKKFLLAYTTLLLTAMAATAQTNLYVDSSVAASSTGASWALPYKTLSEALSVANAASTAVKYVINVAKGTYYPTGVQNSSNRDSSFMIARGGIRLYGGYPSGGGTRNVTLNPTTLSGEIGSTDTYTDNSYHILVAAGINALADSMTIDGFIIRNGYASGVTTHAFPNNQTIAQSSGAGIFISNVEGRRLTISQCSFIANTSASLYGSNAGAICNSGSGVIITGCTFTHDTTTGGGGAIANYNSVEGNRITNCVFTGNKASTGGAIYTSVANDTITACVFTGNAASTAGGAISSINSSGIPRYTNITSCTFTNNSANTNGGGIYAYGTTVQNAVMAGNSAGNNGGAAYLYNTNNNSVTNINSVLTHSIMTGNKAAYGGAVYIQGGPYNANSAASAISYCTIANDTATFSGGGIFNTVNSLVNITYNNINSNKATDGGGGYFNSGTSAFVSNDTVSGNVATGRGGAFFCKNASSNALTFNNTLITGNKAQMGGGIYDSMASIVMVNCTLGGDTASSGNGICNIASSPTIYNSIIWEGAANSFFNTGNSMPMVSYSDVQGGYAGTGNISGTPLFLNSLPATAAPTTGGNYKVYRCSPTMDAGINSAVNTAYSDLAGNPRIAGAQVDMGTYEIPGNTLTITICQGATYLFGGQTYGVAGTYTQPYQSALGCDSTVTLILTVTNINASVSQSGNTLTASPAGATYQWVDCANGNTPITGATGQTFTPTANGQYAVAVTMNGCTQTSACKTITGLSVAGVGSLAGISVYPNPAGDVLTVAAGKYIPSGIILRDMAGKAIIQVMPADSTTHINVSRLAAGMYLLEVYGKDGLRYTTRLSVAH